MIAKLLCKIIGHKYKDIDYKLPTGSTLLSVATYGPSKCYAYFKPTPDEGIRLSGYNKQQDGDGWAFDAIYGYTTMPEIHYHWVHGVCDRCDYIHPILDMNTGREVT